MSDPYTMEVRLCDDAGMVSNERVKPGSPGTAFDPDLTYLRLHNNLAARNTNPDTRKPVTEPYACTGHAHLAGEHIRCTSPAHAPGLPDDLNRVLRDQSVVVPQDGAVWATIGAKAVVCTCPASGYGGTDRGCPLHGEGTGQWNRTHGGPARNGGGA
ncbi:MAG: hypothetical protein M3340_02120 [Actinomycetota bacterium]|nr:hypothetical protein [Actinomycetota bacterium]